MLSARGMRRRGRDRFGASRMQAAAVLCAILSPILGAASPAFADAPVRRTLAPDDLYRVEDVSDPQVSPDGLWVAYVVTLNDRESDEARSAIWMVSWDGTQRLALTAAADGTAKPRWSPDGRYLSFLSTPTGSDKPQIVQMRMICASAVSAPTFSACISMKPCPFIVAPKT